MTIAELIAELNKYDSNLPVFIEGYESGIDWPEVRAIRFVKQMSDWDDPNRDRGGMFGRWDEAFDSDKDAKTGVLLERP